MLNLSEIEPKRLKVKEFHGITSFSKSQTAGLEMDEWIKTLPDTIRIVDIKYAASDARTRILVIYIDDATA